MFLVCCKYLHDDIDVHVQYYRQEKKVPTSSSGVSTSKGKKYQKSSEEWRGKIRNPENIVIEDVKDYKQSEAQHGTKPEEMVSQASTTKTVSRILF